MFKKFALWFLCFALSILVSYIFRWTEQGKAFLYINLGAQILVVLCEILISVGIVSKFAGSFNTRVVSVICIIGIIIQILIILFATWGATKLFDVDFFVAYQIMTFGQCLCSSSDSGGKNKTE